MTNQTSDFDKEKETGSGQQGFTYTYSAKQQEELEKIRSKYLPPEHDKMEQLRRLDKAAERPGKIAAIVVGILGALLLGLGLACVTTDWSEAWFIPGVIIGVIGLSLCGAAAPINNVVTKKQRQKYALQVLELTKELGL